MKVVVVTILILVLFFSCSLYFNHYINVSSEKIIDMIEELEEAVEKKGWEEAQSHMREAKETWNDIKKVWLIILEHYEIDKIDIVMARLQQFINIEKETEALGEIAELKGLVKHVVEKEIFSIANLL